MSLAAARLSIAMLVAFALLSAVSVSMVAAPNAKRSVPVAIAPSLTLFLNDIFIV